MKAVFQAILCIGLAFITLYPAPSAAQSYVHTYISPKGTDSNNCNAAPCATFSKAFSQTVSGGRITCADRDGGTAFYASISRPIIFDCDSGAAYLWITTTNASDVVVVRGVALDNNGSSSAVSFNGSGTLILDRVSTGPIPSSTAVVQFSPNGPGKLIVSDSTITATGQGAAGGGIIVKPSGTGSARVSLERVNIAGNVFGIALDGSGSTGGINATIADSMISGNTQDGVVATTTAGHAPIGVFVSNTKSVNNAYGIRSIGPGVTARVKNSEIVGNNTGIATSGGGALLSSGGNSVQANGSNGSFTGSVPVQ